MEGTADIIEETSDDFHEIHITNEEKEIVSDFLDIGDFEALKEYFLTQSTCNDIKISRSFKRLYELASSYDEDRINHLMESN